MTDFLVINVIFSVHYFKNTFNTHEGLHIMSLSAMLLCANTALAIAQVFFSTIVHKHYKAIDSVLRQIALLFMSFMLLFVCFMNVCKHIFHVNTPPADFIIRSVLLIACSLVTVRLIEYWSIKKLRVFGRNSRSVLFAGKPDIIKDAYRDINMMPYAGLRILGYYSDTPIESDKGFDLVYLGTLNDLQTRLDDEERFTDDIYCTELPANKIGMVSRLVDYSMRHGIQFNYVPPYIYEFGYCLKPRVEGELVVFSNLSEPLLELGNRVIKRSFDIAVSGIAVLCLLPFIPIIGAIIKLSSPGPIFFKQERTGLNNRNFQMLKFRSMHVNADSDRLQASKDDPRKFAFGSFMRHTNIDELPQFFNVLMGDMSIVGPRPHMLAHTDEYRKKIYEYMLRHMVRPGITGWAQTTGYRGETPELWQMSGRVQRDLWYIQNWTFWLDIRIILRTAMQFFIHDEKAF